MALDLAGWRTTLPPRYAPKVMGDAAPGAAPQACAGGCSATNPAVDAGPNPEADPAPVRVYTVAELDAIAAELSGAYRALPAFGAATGLRPEEWSALERRHVDRPGGSSSVEQKNVGASVVPGGKTKDSVREVPLTRPRARRARPAAAAGSTRRCCSPRRRAGRSTSTTSASASGRLPSRRPGVCTPATPYDMRDTFASNALAAGVTVFELASVMGTSVRMIETALRRAARRGARRNRRAGSTRSKRRRRRPQKPMPTRHEPTFMALMWHDLRANRTTAKGGNVRFAERKSDGSDGTRTRDLRRDRPAF